MLTHWEGQTAEWWKDRWGLGLLEFFETLPSTNDRAKALAREGAGPWTLVLAEGQSQGRGRGGKPWVSMTGKGLWMSLLVASEGAGADALLPLRVGVALARTLDERTGTDPDGTGERPTVKWPNDVLLGSRKVAGVLCEATGSGSIAVGIGVNVRPWGDDVPEELRATAVPLEEWMGSPVERGPLATGILSRIKGSLAGAGPLLTPAELQAFSERDALLGQAVESEIEGRGVALGLTPRGTLLLERAGGGLAEVRAGSVRRIIKE